LLEILEEDGMCFNCSSFSSTKRRAYLVRQKRVQGALDACDVTADYEFSDRIFGVVENDICDRTRPDFLWDLGTHVVILEVDEDQHANRQEYCECVRMRNITESLMRPTIFVRYNPDGFKQDGRKVQVSHHKRMEKLIRWIKQLKGLSEEEIGDSKMSVLHLFFTDREEALEHVF
jgi:hypothetical protein